MLMTFREARVSQAWQSKDSVSMSATMVKTSLTGSGRFGFRSRALTRGSVVSESLERSTASPVEGMGDCAEFGVAFFNVGAPCEV